MGEKFGYVSDDLSTSSDGQTLIHFEADGEVLALLPSGNPQKIDGFYIVKNLRASQEPTWLHRFCCGFVGSKVVVEFAAKEGKRIVTFDDKPADPDVAFDFLQAVLWITIRKHTDQEIYGSSAPVAVGASWPINAATYLDYNEEGDPHFTSAEGSLTLQSVEGDGDNQIGIIAGTYTVKGQNPPSDPGSFLGQFRFTASRPAQPPRRVQAKPFRATRLSRRHCFRPQFLSAGGTSIKLFQPTAPRPIRKQPRRSGDDALNSRNSARIFPQKPSTLTPPTPPCLRGSLSER